MTRFFHTKGFEREWHPSEEDLLLYVDGELKATKSSTVRSHLEACWTCRARVEELQETITSFIQYLDSSLTPNLDPPPRQWQTFQSRLRSAGPGAGGHPLRAQFLCWFRRALWAHRPAYVTLLVLVTLLSLFILRFEHISPVSANQLLTNATEAQVRRIRQVPQPVVHQKLNVQRSSPAALPESRVTWEIWCDPGQKRFFQRFESIDGTVRLESRSENFSTLNPPAGGVHNPAAAAEPRSAAARKPAEIPELVRQLEQVYQTNRMDLTRPLSPSVYRSWRESMRQKSEEVKEIRLSDGGKAFALVTTVGQAVPENGIVKAELYVRSEDWHPFEQRLTVRAETGLEEFQIAETNFEVLALSALPPLIFPEQRALPAAAASLPPRLTREPESKDADSRPFEMEALYVLHETNACLGEPLEVVRDSAGQIRVRGLVDTVERKQELVAAFRAHPQIQLDLMTVSEALNSISQRASTSESADEDAAPAPSEPSLIHVRENALVIQKELTDYFARKPERSSVPNSPDSSVDSKIKEFSNEAISLSQKAMDEAWALRRLTERFSAKEREKLQQPLKWLLAKMFLDHLTSLQEQTTRWRALLEPFLSQMAANQPPSAAATEATVLTEAATTGGHDTGECEANVLHLFNSVETLERLTRGLFGSEEISADSPRRISQSWLAELRQLECQVRNLHTQFESLEPSTRLSSNRQGK